MPLLKTVSGIRGTIGESVGNGLTPVDIVSTVSAYAHAIKKKYNHPTLVVGRDGRYSGASIQALVMSTLQLCGVDVVDIGLTTTPSLAYLVYTSADYVGGIIITASHNPENWNALKLLNQDGEFIHQSDINHLYQLADNNDFSFAKAEHIGSLQTNSEAIPFHVEGTLRYPLVEQQKIKASKFRVVADVINSSGAIALKLLFERLGVEYILLNETLDKKFAHNPEPLPDNLSALSEAVRSNRADLGIAVDPDVDRVCFVDEKGGFFGEEYTIVAIADYILATRKGSLVSNLSSSLALRDVAEKHGQSYFASKVGEAHVVAKMKEVHAIFGGEGNGGVIVPDFHYGRDAIIGIGLFLSFLAEKKITVSELRKLYPMYELIKDKLDISSLSKTKDEIVKAIKEDYPHHPIDEQDGLKIFTDNNSWVQVRFSNTEPIMRIFAESPSSTVSQQLIDRIKQKIIH